ncbi:hypothetical protein PPACK8108_LOCUS5767 [Phakopsora pachyrhizi]|uniref:PH domain-containing protein n=1 Tax=Phakopsora pachyrhizi TaxID=170000 RepID=A0AAV0ASX5_PHAPC|nr:hypothetical protein PPACK8108_LOCUS5767 [Phakopsora pachyrhizi]
MTKSAKESKDENPLKSPPKASLNNKLWLSLHPSSTSASPSNSLPNSRASYRHSIVPPEVRQTDKIPSALGSNATATTASSDVSLTPHPLTPSTSHGHQAGDETAINQTPNADPNVSTFTKIKVTNSHIRANEKNKEVISFSINVNVVIPPESDPERKGPKASWVVEKFYSDVLALDHIVKSKHSKSQKKTLAQPPDHALFKDHAPSKAVLEQYLKSLCSAQLKEKGDVCEFFNSNIVINKRSSPSNRPGFMQGYLTKKGRNFGGWQTRYYVLNGPVLEYFDSAQSSPQQDQTTSDAKSALNSSIDCPHTPDPQRPNISGPMNGAPITGGYHLKPVEEKRAKFRSAFWGFGGRNAGSGELIFWA